MRINSDILSIMFEYAKENNEAEIRIEKLFEDADVVILGETHHGTHSKEILSLLGKCLNTIKGVFLEMPIDYQKDIDTYLRSGETTEKLESFFQGAEKEGNNIRNLLEMFDALKPVGKRVICIDSSKRQTAEYSQKAKHGYYFTKGKTRDEDMFSVIQDYYNREPGKYLAIVGAGHIEPGKHHRTNEDTLESEMQKFSGKYVAVPLRS